MGRRGRLSKVKQSCICIRCIRRVAVSFSRLETQEANTELVPACGNRRLQDVYVISPFFACISVDRPPASPPLAVSASPPRALNLFTDAREERFIMPPLMDGCRRRRRRRPLRGEKQLTTTRLLDPPFVPNFRNDIRNFLPLQSFFPFSSFSPKAKRAENVPIRAYARIQGHLCKCKTIHLSRSTKVARSERSNERFFLYYRREKSKGKIGQTRSYNLFLPSFVSRSACRAFSNQQPYSLLFVGRRPNSRRSQ